MEECSRPEEIAAECIKAIKRCCSIAEPADTRAQYVREAIRIMKEQFTDDLRWRINAAIDLIRQNRELSIRDIGKMAGYSSETYFYKVLKKYRYGSWQDACAADRSRKVTRVSRGEARQNFSSCWTCRFMVK